MGAVPASAPVFLPPADASGLPPPPQYYQASPRPGYQYNQQFTAQLPPQSIAPQIQRPMKESAREIEHPPSSPDPIQNVYYETPRPMQVVQIGEPPAAKREPESEPEPEPEPDYSLLLLSLADEYFARAKKLMNRSEEFYQLTAMGLGCIESALTNFHLEPLREAQLSLRYAQVLFDETENHDDAERVLTKAIEVCERNGFVDLKYSMQLLLSCVLFQSRPKAAVKDLQNLIEEAEVYKHAAWEYALRYQLVMFHLSDSNSRDLQQAMHQLEKLGHNALKNNDKAVAAFSTTVEAMLHLQSPYPDAVTSAQRAIASARPLLMDSAVCHLVQLAFTLELIDLCCSIRRGNVEQNDEKRKFMHELFGKVGQDKSWLDQGSVLSVPVCMSSLRGLALQKGGLVSQVGGKAVLQFSWLDADEAEQAGFLLSVASKARKGSSDRAKVQEFIDGGVNRTRETVADYSGKTSLAAREKLSKARLMECRFLIEQTFLQCSSGNWKGAWKSLETSRQCLAQLGTKPPRSITLMVQYLKGVIEQGRGNLEAALSCYQSADLDLAQFQRQAVGGAAQQQTAGAARWNPDLEVGRNICILAAMNRLVLTNEPSHTLSKQRADLLDQVKSAMKSCTDKNIMAAYTLVHQQVGERGVVASKNSLVSALNAAKAVANTQITALVLTVMQQNFFRGVTDEHANKCVKAAVANVQQWGDPTWSYVAAGIEAESQEFRGNPEAARHMKEEMARRLQRVPSGVRQRILSG
ncbi:hypothetical protein DV736_g2730, partial [Chaetothyriales sp. CBS 134916]